MPATLTQTAPSVAPVTHNEPTSQEVLTNMPLAVIKMMSKKGQFCRLVMEKNLKMLKGREQIRKHSELNCRIGVEYEHINKVKEIRENGTPPGAMAWGSWVLYPILKTHNGNYYIRVSTIPNNVPATKYFRGGLEITKEQAKADCQASEFRERDDLIVFDVNVSNVISLNGELV
jgi:hypothetical protein